MKEEVEKEARGDHTPVTPLSEIRSRVMAAGVPSLPLARSVSWGHLGHRLIGWQ